MRQCVVQRAEFVIPIISKLSHCIVVMQQQAKSGAITLQRISKHRQIAVGITEGKDRSAAQVQTDIDDLLIAIVEASHRSQLSEHQLSIDGVELALVARSDHLLGWDAIQALRNGSHRYRRQ